MGLRADATAWFLQRSASRSARYGDALHFSGTDLPDPTRLSVPTRRGAVTCWVYRPAGDPVGAYVHLHGGAFLMRYRHHPRRLDVPDGAVAVGGFSAGGNLAASACLQARDLRSCAPRLQVLGVPSLDVAEASSEKTSVLARPMVSPELLALVRATYFKDAEGDRYAARLADDGVPVTHRVVPRRDHYFLDGDRAAARAVLDLVTDALTAALR